MSGYVFWDTNLLIYWIEEVPVWSEHVERLLCWQEEHGFKTVTSSLSLGELLVHPLRHRASDLARSYARQIDEMGCIPFGSDEAWRFAEVRATYPSLRPPDAIQLACASVLGVELFVTNDERLSACSLRGIKRIACLASWKP